MTQPNYADTHGHHHEPPRRGFFRKLLAMAIGGIAVATVPIARVRDAIRAGREQPAPVVD